MAQPTLILWIDSLDELSHKEERARLLALNAGIATRAHRLTESKVLTQATIRPESTERILEALPKKSWLSPEQIVIWQLSGQVPATFTFQITVVCLDPKIDVSTLDQICAVTKTFYEDLQIPMSFTLIWHKADSNWQKGSCVNYAYRYAVSDRVTDWQNVIEHLVLASVDSGLSGFVSQQAATAVEVVWCGAASVSLGMKQTQHTVLENMYRKMIEVLRADDLTQEEVDASKQVARQNRLAYARDMMTLIQKQVNENFDFAVSYVFDESSDAPISMGAAVTDKQKRRPSGFTVRNESALGTSLFARRADWWTKADDDMSFAHMLTELLNKDTVTEIPPQRNEIDHLLTENFSRLRDRVDLVVRESSQQSLDRFFGQIFSQIESQSSYGLRNIQQSLYDYLKQMEQGQLLTFKGTVVASSEVSTGTYFEQLAATVRLSLTESMAKVTRRRRSAFSLIGSVLRMMLLIPLLNGAFSLVGPSAYQDVAAFLIPVSVILIGLGSAIESYRQFHVYARQVRNQFVDDVLGNAVLGIIQSAHTRERARVIEQLSHLNKIYSELIESYDQTHAEQVKPVDSISSNTWTLQQIDTVWGTSSIVVQPGVNDHGDWELILGEHVSIYEIDGQTRLSLQSQTQVEVNRDARAKGLYRGSVLLLQQVAEELRRKPLTKKSVETRMRTFCRTYVKRVFENPMNKLHLLYELNRSAQVVMPSTKTLLNRTTMLGDGKHWVWLNTAANQNATPRADVPASTKEASVLLIPEFLQGSIEGRYGRPSPHWVEPTAIAPISKAFDEEIIQIRMDIDYVK
jgi:hypothetical protein